VDGWLDILERDLPLEEGCKGVEEIPLSKGLALMWDMFSKKDSDGAAPTSNLESDSNL